MTNVTAIDAEYRYAMVCGASFEYIWILSREKAISDTIKKKTWIKLKN
jgi:apolipoprotein D and lipocalin family protein